MSAGRGMRQKVSGTTFAESLALKRKTGRLEMTAIVIEEQPLVRLGLQRLLERMPGIGAVHAIDPAGIATLDPGIDASMAVYGMSGDASDNWHLLRRLHHRLPHLRILLLSDNMWLSVSSSPLACGVVEHLPKSASIERMESAILRMLDGEGFVPLHGSAADRTQFIHRSRIAL